MSDPLPLNVRMVSPNAILPSRSTPGSAGLDLYTVEPAVLTPHTPTKIRTGIAIQIPLGHVGLIFDRSGLGSKGVMRLAGVIDADYEGEVVVCLLFAGSGTITLAPGDRIAQLVIVPIPAISVREAWDETRKSDRGTGGFGSTGA